MKTRALLVSILTATSALLCSSCLPEGNVQALQGSGATFPAPLYKRWFLEYYRLHSNVQVNYQPTGSGAGVRQFSEELVDFGASDAAMSDEEIAKVKPGVRLLPMTAGSIVLCYNVPDLAQTLRLSRECYVRIFLGEIGYWDDEAIQKDNPSVKLPHTHLTVVRRADGSGTTYAFTNHLTTISEAWKKGPGKGKSVIWPKAIGARGNAGVTAMIQQTPGAIGYLEYGYAELSHLPMAVLQNQKGEWIEPSPESGSAALADVKIPDNLRLFVPDPPGKKAYPIVTCTWILCYQKYRDAEKAKTLKGVLRYCLTDGQPIAAQLGYIPLPDELRRLSLASLEQIQP